MIDTDKYEGHSAGKWRVRTRKGTFTVKDCLGDEVAAVNDFADARLIADAPLLLAEVKRLHERLDLAERYIIEPTLIRNYFADVVSKGLDDERDNLGDEE